jgi:hypothetical protein
VSSDYRRKTAGRWRKGVSGNPRGRPPGSRHAALLALDAIGARAAAVVCLTLAKWETVSGQFGGYLIEDAEAWSRHMEVQGHRAELPPPHRPISGGFRGSSGPPPQAFIVADVRISFPISVPVPAVIARKAGRSGRI